MVEAATQLSPLANPLGADGAAGRQRWQGIGIVLGEVPGRAKIALRGDGADPAVVAALGRALGFAPPLRSGATLARDGLAALCLGPDEWFVVAASGAADPIVSAIRAASGEIFLSAVDITSGLSCLTIQGENARAVLAKGTSVDLHPRSFKPGRCASLGLARMRVIVHQTGEEPAYDLYVQRSFARHLWNWLKDSALEFAT